LCIQHFVVDLHQETKTKTKNVMNNAQINTIAENKEFIAACANFAKECGISAADWNANKGHFVGMILGMAKVHGFEF
jgi:glycerate-2-kinase